MWRPGERVPAALTIALLAVGVMLVGILAVRGLGSGGKSAAAATRPKRGPRASRSQQRAARTLTAFVYGRGSFWAGGNVKACTPNWRPPAGITAQLHCRAFGQPIVYTQFASGARANAYFDQLASRGHPGSGDWGPCDGWLPRSHWSRAIFLRRERESGTVAFRQDTLHASVIWIWPDRRAVAAAQGDIFHRRALCDARNLNA